MMEKHYTRLADTLSSSLKLKQPPVAVCFTDSLPASVPLYNGQVPAGCRFWQDGAVSAFATASADHALCAVGVYTHNLEQSHAQQTDLVDALRAFGDLGYVRSQDLPLIPVLASRSKYVVYSPLSQSPLAPGVVLLIVDAGQTLILSEAVQQVENQNAPAMGRPACAVIPHVMNTGRAALSLGCCGARAYLDVLADDVALFALPGATLEAYVQRIQVLSEANSALAKFHHIRRRDVESGKCPTVQDSLSAVRQ